MRKKSSAFLISLFLFGLVREIGAEDAKQAASRPVIVIEALGGSQAEVPGWQPALGQGISEMLLESLESSDSKFQVLETTEATDLQKESKPGASNSGNGETKPDAGGSAGSDFTFCGKVTQFMVQTNGSSVGDFLSSSPFAGLGAKVSTAHVQIEWRIVDTETKKVIKRGISVASASGSQFDMTALTTPDGKAAVAGSATTFTKTAAGGKNGTNIYSNIFKGLILGNDSSGAGGDNAWSSNGITTKSAKTSSQAVPKAGGAVTGSGSGTAVRSAKTTSQTATKAGGGVAGSGGDGIAAIIDYGDPAFMNSALGKATCKVITNIIEQLDAISLPEPGRVAKVKATTDALKHAPGKVLAVAGKDTIIVSLGSKQGFKEGDQLELYQPTDVKDDKGSVVFTDEKLVGEITLSAVQEERSRGSYAGDAQVQQGWTVKAK